MTTPDAHIALALVLAALAVLPLWPGCKRHGVGVWDVVAPSLAALKLIGIVELSWWWILAIWFAWLPIWLVTATLRWMLL